MNPNEEQDREIMRRDFERKIYADCDAEDRRVANQHQDAADRAAERICAPAFNGTMLTAAAIIREEYAGELARLQADIEVLEEFVPGHWGEPPRKTIAALEADKRELVYTLGALTGTYDDVINGLGIIGGEEMILEQSRAVLAKHGGR
jgi:hypothetical protein